MQVITASEFVDWKRNPVTQAFFAAVIDRIEEAKERLSIQAGLNAIDDNYFRGFIQAHRESLEFRIDDLQETAND